MTSTLTLPAQLTILRGRAPLDELQASIDALPAGSAVVLDATALQSFDSSALALIVGLKRHCRAQGRTLTVHGLPERLERLARLYGVAELIEA